MADIYTEPVVEGDKRVVVMVFPIASFVRLAPSTPFLAELILEVGEDGCRVAKSVQTLDRGKLLNKGAGLDLLDSYLPAELDGNDGS